MANGGGGGFNGGGDLGTLTRPRTPHAFSGWAAVQRAVNSHTPQTLRRIRATNAATRATLPLRKGR